MQINNLNIIALVFISLVLVLPIDYVNAADISDEIVMQKFGPLFFVFTILIEGIVLYFCLRKFIQPIKIFFITLFANTVTFTLIYFSIPFILSMSDSFYALFLGPGGGLIIIVFLESILIFISIKIFSLKDKTVKPISFLKSFAFSFIINLASGLVAFPAAFIIFLESFSWNIYF